MRVYRKKGGDRLIRFQKVVKVEVAVWSRSMLSLLVGTLFSILLLDLGLGQIELGTGGHFPSRPSFGCCQDNQGNFPGSQAPSPTATLYLEPSKKSSSYLGSSNQTPAIYMNI